MAAYRRVCDSRHLQADCQEPGSAAEPYARQSSMGYLLLLDQLTFDIVVLQMHGSLTDGKRFYHVLNVFFNFSTFLKRFFIVFKFLSPTFFYIYDLNARTCRSLVTTLCRMYALH